MPAGRWFNPFFQVTCTPMLELRSLSRLAVGPVDLTLADGECVAIEGRSGAGKSVLLRMVADLDPHQGEALLDGVPASRMPAPRWRAQVTYVPADSGWWDRKVGAHFVDVEAARALLSRVGIAADALDWPVERLSTGERQRLALLRALQSTTRVLLLDEPTSGLDQESVAQVEALLGERIARGLAVIMVTHDPAQGARLARRRFELKDGALAEKAA